MMKFDCFKVIGHQFFKHLWKSDRFIAPDKTFSVKKYGYRIYCMLPTDRPELTM